MKQIIQNNRSGKLAISTLPKPIVRAGHLLVATRRSVLSAGTEKMARELAQKSLLAKARSRPDHVRRVLEKMRSEGFWNTVQQVRAKLDEPMPMGYCSAGVVLACGAGVQEFQPGDLVASNGPHAEVVCVPKNLCACVPDGVALDQAAFTVLGAIAMQGVRLSKLSLGETAFVIGLGLVGQITVALLKAAGVRVIGTDLDSTKCDLAKRMGAEEARPGLRVADVEQMTRGLGADAVLITASTKSNAPIDLAAHTVRQKGRVVLVGVVGLELDRRPFYFKEAEFVVSCSYGPGRYDPRYEENGNDYPAAYVRWTEQRNMQAVLDLMASGQLDVGPLISHRFPINEADNAYELIENGNEPYLGIVLEYPQREHSEFKHTVELKPRAAGGKVNVGCLGAGNFARSVLLPNLCKLPDVNPVTLCSSGGLSAVHTGEKLGFARATSREDEVIQNPSINTVFIITRHDLHADQVAKAVRARKHVFVEKPLCLTTEQLADIETELLAAGENAGQLMVGFNRRFSPAARAVKSFFSGCRQPLTISIRFNAGSIEADHWTQNDELGGGRIIGEACHAIDLATYLAGSPIVRVFAESIGGPDSPVIRDDQCFITLRHANGSVSNVAYLAGGDRAFPKERVEVFGGGQVAVIDDFRFAEGWSGGKRKRLWKGTQDKGHSAELAAFVESIRKGGAAPIPWLELRATTLASILAVRSLRDGSPQSLGFAEIAPDTHGPTVRMAG